MWCFKKEIIAVVAMLSIQCQVGRCETPELVPPVEKVELVGPTLPEPLENGDGAVRDFSISTESNALTEVDKFDLADLPESRQMPLESRSVGLVINKKSMDWQRARNRELLFQALNVIDFVQTARCLSRNACSEQNPLLGHNPSIKRLAAFKLAAGVIHFGATKFLLKEWPEIADLWLNASIAVQGGAVLYNMNTVF